MIQYQLIIKYRKVFKMSKLTKQKIKELSIAQQKINEARQLLESFNESNIDHSSYDFMRDKIEDLEIVENDIDTEFELFE
tara:strand:+ start:673 stop:912 length:240 start_codon:yes stop_codon:yes gene_type:complete